MKADRTDEVLKAVEACTIITKESEIRILKAIADKRQHEVVAVEAMAPDVKYIKEVVNWLKAWADRMYRK